MPSSGVPLPVAINATSHPVVKAVAGLSRFLLHRWCGSLQVKGLDRFLSLLRDGERQKRGQGVLTYANHISVMDDPTIFGSLPKDAFKYKATTRWTLGATDILFTNSFLSRLFKAGQVLPIDRGRGVYQPSIDQGIDLLESGQWIHMFPEGYVNLSRKAIVRRFKWGIGRILLEAGAAESSYRPIVVPMWISGLDAMMPEHRQNPRWLPRPGAKVTITFGEAINDTMNPLLNRLSEFATERGDQDIVDESTTEALLVDLQRLSPLYPSPSANFYPPITPLMQPPDGIAWPVPLAQSRSSKSLQAHGESSRAKMARSMIAAELRAHLVQLGERSGVDLNLAHEFRGELGTQEKE